MQKIQYNRQKKNPARTINSYGKVAEYMVNIQKSITFLYSSDQQGEFKIKNIIPFTLIPPKLNT